MKNKLFSHIHKKELQVLRLEYLNGKERAAYAKHFQKIIFLTEQTQLIMEVHCALNKSGFYDNSKMDPLVNSSELIPY